MRKNTQDVMPIMYPITPKVNKCFFIIFVSHFLAYFRITPGRIISPNPISEHLEIGVKSSTKKAGHWNFKGRSIEVATLAITDCPKKYEL
jgi:hypothetical protein